MKIRGSYFYGNKVSAYGLDNHRVDYRTLAKSFEGVLNNNIMNLDGWEQISDDTDTEAIDKLTDEIKHLTAILSGMEPGTAGYNALDDKIDDLYSEIEELESEPDIFQYYIVSDAGAEILQEANEIVFYNNDLDMYVWGVTHFGTSWDYVLTNIEIEGV